MWPSTSFCQLGQDWWFKVARVEYFDFWEYVLREKVNQEDRQHGRGDDSISWLGRCFFDFENRRCVRGHNLFDSLFSLALILMVLP